MSAPTTAPRRRLLAVDSAPAQRRAGRVMVGVAAVGVVVALSEFSTFAETAGPALQDTTETLRELEDVGATVDQALAAVSNLPIGLDYDPEAGLGETIGSLADTLEPLSAQFTSTADEIGRLNEDIETLRTDLEALNVTVIEVNEELADTDVLIEEYRINIARARALAVATRDDVEGDAGWMRLLIVLASVNFAIGQIVPLWFGRELLHRARGTPVTVTEVVAEVESIEEQPPAEV
jgi:hypothetical protein